MLFDWVGSRVLFLLVVAMVGLMVVVVVVRLEAGFAFVVEWEGG